MEKKDGFFGSGKMILAAVGAVVGILLLIIGGRSEGRRSVTVRETGTEAEEQRVAAYAAELERQVADLCGRVTGDSGVSVCVRLESGFCAVYAREGETYVKVGSGTSQQALYLYESPPRVAGVGIVCHGGGDDGLRRELVGLVSAMLGVGSNKIYVAEAQN